LAERIAAELLGDVIDTDERLAGHQSGAQTFFHFRLIWAG
jgi:hypothetical protein